MLGLRRPLIKLATHLVSFVCSPTSKAIFLSLQPAFRSLSVFKAPTTPIIIPAHSSVCTHMSASNTPPIGEGAVPVICLTPVESALFSQLKQFAQHWNSSREQSGGVPCVMRVCGGWVRDKLLHKDNDDIDICLDTCSGQQFTTELKAWYDSSGLQSLCSSVGIVKASSEKSKHLETAIIRVTVTGEDVPPNTVVCLDFVQLRCETYAEHSRHPEVGVATPEQDAFRRDFTINAMSVYFFRQCVDCHFSAPRRQRSRYSFSSFRFYNILDETVEDFTGNGIRDLRLGVLRTPINPVQTLRDDPLRALRAIRFMCVSRFFLLCYSFHFLCRGRFNFTLDQSLRDALNDVEVKRKLLEVQFWCHAPRRAALYLAVAFYCSKHQPPFNTAFGS